MKGRWPIGYGMNIKALRREEVPGSNPRASPFWLYCCNNIYIYIYIYITKVCPLVWRWFYPRFYPLLWPDLAWSRQIWRTRQILFFFLNFWIRVVIGHFPTATWQPMTGPHGPPIRPRHPLHRQPAMSVPHHRTDATSLPTHHATTSPCHVTVQTVQTATWKNPTGPRIGPEVPNMGDTWQPLVLPHHHVDVMHDTCHLLLLPHVLYGC
jgi:hypothetical protein